MLIWEAKDYKKYIKDLKQKNKFNAYRTKCNLGHYHKSGAEAHYCDYLLFLKKAGKIKDFEKEPKYELYVNEIKITTHYPDFKIYFNDDTFEIHEVKGGRGTQTDLWRLKKNLFMAIYPEIKYIVIEHFS